MSRRLLVLAAALVFAVAGTAAVLAYVSRADARALAGQQPVSVIVTTGAIPRGTTLGTARSAGLLERQALASRAVPPSAVRELAADMDDLVAASDLAAGEVLLQGRFVEQGELVEAGSVPVPDGKLAVTVELTDPARVAEFLEPGDEVAVLHFREGEPSTTRMLLPRVEVLGVGATTGAPTPTQQAAAEGQAAPAKAVSTALITFAVDERQAERLVHGANTGILHLGLLDETTRTTAGSGVDDASLYR